MGVESTLYLIFWRNVFFFCFITTFATSNDNILLLKLLLLRSFYTGFTFRNKPLVSDNNFMKNSNKTLFFLIALAAIISCSPKRDTIISRTYNSITTKYNILYNGNIAFQTGIDEINKKHKDNFREQLFIEPITFNKNKIVSPALSGLPKSAKNTDDKNLSSFERAEDKAVKAIQLHSMNFYGRERNNQIDDAYLLLGKSRYYTQRFVEAIEAFNYIIANYPYADLIYETRVWRAKTNIRLNNEKLAIKSLKIVLKKEDISDKIKEQVHTALAMAYVKTDSIQNVITHLKKAIETHKGVEQASRNMYILGQIYKSENKKDSAAIVFKKLVNFKKAPYKFRVHSNVEFAKVTSNYFTAGGLISKFYKLVKNRENRKYLDILYYQIGVLEYQRNSIDDAILYYKKSVNVADGDDYQKTFPYESLGNIYFDRANFILASSYYDSVLQVSKESVERRIRRVKRKHKSLATLITFETVLKTNDSILDIVAMTEGDRRLFFENYIEKLKKQDEEKDQQELNSLSFGSSFGGGTSKQSINKGKWYFYNAQSLSFGKSKFLRIWGNRPLEDNWRISEREQIINSKDSVKTKQLSPLKYELSTYLDALPKNQSQIDSLKYDRNESLYQTGIIYKEQFRNIYLAIDRFKRLLSLNPEKNVVLPTNYHLYQIFKELEDTKADSYKDNIITQYPDSKYAQIIQNIKSSSSEEPIGEIESIYKEIYYLYKGNKFEDVVSQITEIAPTIQRSKLIAKFELLKAFAIGKYQKEYAYKEALEFVLLNYGNTEEGIQAKEILGDLKGTDKLSEKLIRK